jgi:hypothetical protein
VTVGGAEEVLSLEEDAVFDLPSHGFHCVARQLLEEGQEDEIDMDQPIVQL